MTDDATPTRLPTRQELYDQIRESSKEEVILEGMVRYGFWPKAGELPEDPADEIRRIGELERELTSMRTEMARLHNVESMVKAARKRRLEESRAKQKANRERRLQERVERAEQWAQRKTEELFHLGNNAHTAALNDHTSDDARLKAQGLPAFKRPKDLADAMGLDLAALRFLAFDRRVTRVHHYQRFLIPKKSGGTRQISAPMPRLKAAQLWILEHILAKPATHDAAHGFVTARSIVTNATPHVGAAIVVNLDLQDFFPSVTFPRVRGAFKALGYSPAIATVLALICTEPQVIEAELDGKTWYLQQGPRRLPQGGPTSPALTNLICRRLDRRLNGLAAALGFRYTRYADDLSFSAEASDAPAGKLIRRAHHVVQDEGFTVHPDKTHVARSGRRQEVTGLIVNQQLSIDRRTLRKFRATLRQIELDGPEGKTWGHSPDLFASIEGYANFVRMVRPDKGAAFVERVRALKARYA